MAALKATRHGAQRGVRRIGALLLAVLLALTRRGWMPMADELLGRAALAITAIAMPQAAIPLLRERYLPSLYDPDTEEEENATLGKTPAAGQTAPDADRTSASGTGGGISAAADGSRYPDSEEIPEHYRGRLFEVDWRGGPDEGLIPAGEGWIHNYTGRPDGDIEQLLGQQSGLQIDPDESGPQVLIYHTHATESYENYIGEWYDTRNSWRDTEHTNNMTAVGERLKTALEAEGITVLHDTTLHDYPSYSGSYERSWETVERYLKEYPSIRVVLDLHRDGILYDDGSVAKPVFTTADGRRAAQIMVAVACDDGSGTLTHWQQNLRFAAELTAEAASRTPGLMRPVYFICRSYNQELSPGALLLEMGTNGNTLEEACLSAELLAPALAEVLRG